MGHEPVARRPSCSRRTTPVLSGVQAPPFRPQHRFEVFPGLVNVLDCLSTRDVYERVKFTVRLARLPRGVRSPDRDAAAPLARGLVVLESDRWGRARHAGMRGTQAQSRAEARGQLPRDVRLAGMASSAPHPMPAERPELACRRPSLVPPRTAARFVEPCAQTEDHPA